MTDDKPICPICDEGTLSVKHRNEFLKHNGESFSIQYAHSECSVCGVDLVLPKQAKINCLKIKDEHRRIDGFLTSKQIRDIRDRYKLTQAEASVIFGGGANSFSKYERGDVIQSLSMDRLLRLANKNPMTVADLQRMAGVDVTAPDIYVINCEYGDLEEKQDKVLGLRNNHTTITRKEHKLEKSTDWEPKDDPKPNHG